jgi:hypothetical protein
MVVKEPATSSTYSIRFTPSPTFAGTAIITYTLSNTFGASSPVVLDVNVAARPDPSADPDVVGLVNAEIQTARRFADAQVGNYDQRLESLAGTPFGTNRIRLDLETKLDLGKLLLEIDYGVMSGSNLLGEGVRLSVSGAF